MSKNYYLTNKYLLEEIAKSRSQGKMTDRLALGLKAIAEKAADRYTYNFSWKEDQIGEATLRLLEKWHMFDETRYSNAFAYYTEICKMAYTKFWYQNKHYVHIHLIEVDGEFRNEND
jgi:hypothetical protein